VVTVRGKDKEGSVVKRALSLSQLWESVAVVLITVSKPGAGSEGRRNSVT